MEFYKIAFIMDNKKWFYLGAGEDGLVYFTDKNKNIPIFNSIECIKHKDKIRTYFHNQNKEIAFLPSKVK